MQAAALFVYFFGDEIYFCRQKQDANYQKVVLKLEVYIN